MAYEHGVASLATVVGLARNWKRHDLPMLAGSIERWGYLAPITINRTTGRLLAGHGRIDALQQRKNAGGKAPIGIQEQAGEWYIPAYFVEVSEGEEEAAATALNRSQERGGQDDELLAQVLNDIKAHDATLLAIAGYTDEEFEALLQDSGIGAPNVDFKEYDEQVESEVQYCTCPNCGHRFPK